MLCNADMRKLGMTQLQSDLPVINCDAEEAKEEAAEAKEGDLKHPNRGPKLQKYMDQPGET